ncbi:MAG: GNAT family N-acetyltransferase [bacterium]|nr:GNAT family N-acetyltransferase [bacterium]
MLVGKHIELRSIRRDDLDTVIDLINECPDMDGAFPISFLTPLIEKKYFDLEVAPGEGAEDCLLITCKAEQCGEPGSIIGCIAYFKGIRYVEGWELTYHIFRPTHRGKGYASEALRLICRFLFTVSNTPRLQVNLDKVNTGSRKVAEKCGFTYEGTLRQAVLINGRPEDLEMFSMLRKEFI